MANKKRKKKDRPEGVDPNQLRRERLEKRRQQKAEEAERRRKQARRQKVLRQITTLALVLLLVWFFFLRGGRPGEIAGYELITVPETGVNQHTTEAVSYETRPPLAGAHAAQAAPCGTHAQPVPDVNLVHNLEHGTIALLFDPEQVPVEEIREIETTVASADSHMLSAPYPEMDNGAAISVASWGEMIQMDSLDLDAVEEYVDTFRERGPEKQPCDITSNATFEPAPAGDDEAPGDEGTPGGEQDDPEDEVTPGG